VILSVARLFPAKGQSELIRAFAEVKREMPEARLIIAGQDYPPGLGYSLTLKSLVAQLGLTDAIRFVGHRKDIPRLMAACQVFALPSFEEPFGLVFAEAMAMKRPVVAVNSGGAPEVVVHGRTGLLSRPGDVSELAAHLLALLRDPAMRMRMGDQGRHLVETRFNPERMAGDAAQVYASVDPTHRDGRR